MKKINFIIIIFLFYNCNKLNNSKSLLKLYNNNIEENIKQNLNYKKKLYNNSFKKSLKKLNSNKKLINILKLMSFIKFFEILQVLKAQNVNAEFLFEFGGPGKGPGQFTNVNGIDTINSTLYVVDNNPIAVGFSFVIRVQVFSLTGQFQNSFNVSFPSDIFSPEVSISLFEEIAALNYAREFNNTLGTVVNRFTGESLYFLRGNDSLMQFTLGLDIFDNKIFTIGNTFVGFEALNIINIFNASSDSSSLINTNEDIPNPPASNKITIDNGLGYISSKNEFVFLYNVSSNELISNFSLGENILSSQGIKIVNNCIFLVTKNRSFVDRIGIYTKKGTFVKDFGSSQAIYLFLGSSNNILFASNNFNKTVEVYNVTGMCPEPTLSPTAYPTQFPTFEPTKETLLQCSELYDNTEYMQNENVYLFKSTEEKSLKPVFNLLGLVAIFLFPILIFKFIWNKIKNSSIKNNKNLKHYKLTNGNEN